MKSLYLTIMLSGVMLATPAAFALSPGDIAFTGFNADGDDNLAFVALAPIPNGTVIYFTDEEWNGTAWVTNTEAAWTWTATSNIAAGTVVTLDNLNGLFSASTTSNLGTVAAVTDANNNAGLAASNEAVFAFESTGAVDANGVPVPSTFLAVIGNDNAAGTGISLTGTGLSEAAGTALLLAGDNDGLRYIGARSGEATFADYLLLLADTATNWEQQAADGTLYLPFDTTPFVEGTLSNTLTLSVSPASFSESATNPAAAGTVTRSNVAASDLEVTLTSPDSSEVTVPATVTILANQASANFDVTAVDDSLPDGNQLVTLTATAPASVAGTFDVTVEDDGDTLPPTALSAGDIAFTYFNADRDAIGFVALAEIPAGEVIYFTDSEWDGSTVDGSDHFVSGEGDVVWTAPGVAIEAGTVVIIDNYDTTPVASVGSVTGGSGLSSTEETIYAYQGFGVRQPISFLAVIANHPADSIAGTGLTAGVDALYLTNSADFAEYTGARTGQATIADYQPLVANIVANWFVDTVGDGSAYVPSATPFTTGPAGALVSIGAATSVAEGDAGTATMTYTVSRSDNTTEFSIDYAVTGGTASSGVDYAPLAAGTLNFTIGGGLSQTITVDVNGDTEIESNETIIVGLSNLVPTTGVTNLGNASGTGTITNDDNFAPLYTASDKAGFVVKGSVSERSPGVGLSGAEIVAFDPASDRAFLSSAAGIEVIDMSNPAAPAYLGNISLVALGLPSDDISSVNVRDGVLAAAAISSPKTDPGRVAFIDAATAFPVLPGALLGSAVVGAVPDHLTFSPDGTKVLVCNEGELVGDPSADTTPGGVSIIDVSGGFASAPVTTAGFAAFNAQAATLKASGVRIFDGGVPEFDFEPEYLAVSPDGTKAMVTLQEANAVAILDIDTATFTDVVPLGEKDFSTLFADFSDRDGAGGGALVKPTTGNPVFGLYMPDAIASFESGGQTYYVTANEGDDRDDFLTTAETIRAGNAGYDLDDTAFPTEATLKNNANLGRLTVSNAPGLRGDTEPDGDVDRILAYGARSFSILDSSGNIVFDSGDMIETIVAADFPASFDDGRSDNKGPEPEGVAVGSFAGCTFAFVGLERSNMIMVFDITNPFSATYVTALQNPGDVSPEGLLFVSAADSPSGKPLLLVSNEVSASMTAYELDAVNKFTLELFHLADQEANAAAVDDAPRLSAVLNALRAQDVGSDGLPDNSLTLSSGDAFIPGLFYSASDAVYGTEGIADIQIQNELGVQAIAFGNHEFDFNTGPLAALIDGSATGTILGTDFAGTSFPYLSGNLNFAGDANMAPLVTADHQAPQPNKIAATTVITVNGEKIGVVGATTPTLGTISSPGSVGVTPAPFGGTPSPSELDALAAIIQADVDALLLAEPTIDKVILLAHMQQISIEQELATRLTDVDIIVAGGSNTRLFDSNDRIRAGDTNQGPYPIILSDAESMPVAVVNTDGSYKYLGRLVIDFDDAGNIVPGSYDVNVSGAYATDAQGVTDLGPAAVADPEIQQIAGEIGAEIIATDGNWFGVTDVYLNGLRSGSDVDGVRNQETNLGNITADANLFVAKAADPAVVMSLKNGGGIRASIGDIVVLPGETTATRIAPPANPLSGRPAGGISENAIKTALSFNNALTLLTLTKAEIVALLEHGIAASTSSNSSAQGRFPQVSGVEMAFDLTAPAGSRIVSASMVDDNDDVIAPLVAGGNLVGDPAEEFRIVTLNFLANPTFNRSDGDGNNANDPFVSGGDGYPFPNLNSDPLLGETGDPAVIARVNRVDLLQTGVQTGMATFADDGSEQDAMAEYLAATFPNIGSAFAEADVARGLDSRLQNLAFRSDDVLAGAPLGFDLWLALNSYISTGADSDNNGVPDTLEFFFNQNPNDPADLGNLPVVTTANGDKLLTFTTLDGIAGVTGTLVCSEDLGATDPWAPAVEGVDYEVVSSVSSGGETTITLRVLGSNPAKFFRFEVE